MMETHPLLNMLGSYVEIDGWVIIDLNPDTGSIHEYENYDISAESFLDELNTMEMLPSMRLPIPSTLTEAEFESDIANSDRCGDGELTSPRISRGRTKQKYENLAAIENRIEITKRLYAMVEAVNQLDGNAKDPHELNDEPESPEVEDSPHREGSESPETDVDFRQSSSGSTDIEWVSRVKTVGLKASDVVFMGKANRTESVTGEITSDLIDQHEGTLIGSKAVAKEESKEDIFNTSTSVLVEHAKETFIEQDGDSDENEESREKNQRRKDRRNIGLAAGATAVTLAAIWMMERLDMAGSCT